MRSAARLLEAAHADFIVVEFARRTQERIGVAVHAHGAAHDHDDVRAAGERGQRAAVGRRQLEMLNEWGDHVDGRDLDGERLRVVHKYVSLSAGSSPGASASTITPM